MKCAAGRVSDFERGTKYIYRFSCFIELKNGVRKKREQKNVTTLKT